MKLLLLAWGIALFIALPFASRSQQHAPAQQQNDTAKRITITGSVLDDKGVGVENAVVEAKGHNSRAMTTSAGTFSITVPASTTDLVVSYIGMASKEVRLDGKRTITVSMTLSANNNQNDVIVIGYNTKMTAKENPFAAVKVKPSDFENIPAPNMAAALRGRVAGLAVNRQSGKPGSSISLNIRNAAVSTEAGNYGLTTDPLYVIDDIIVGKGTFDALDPTMVEDLTILKDAGAAMYGAAGAKGVVLVRTKRGKPGKTRFSFNGYMSVADATRMPEMLSPYEHALLVNQTNKIRYVDGSGNSFLVSDSALNYLKTLPNNSWIDDLWQPSVNKNFRGSVSGGSENVTFQIGAGYRTNDGNYPGLRNDRYQMRGNINMKLANNFKADLNFSVDNAVSLTNNPRSGDDQAYLEKIYTMPRWVPAQINGRWVNPIKNAKGDGINHNPWAEMQSGFYTDSRSKGYAFNPSVTYAPEGGPLKGLSVRLVFNQSASYTTGKTYTAPYYVYKFKRLDTILYTTELKDSTLVNGGSNSGLSRSQSEGSSYALNLTVSYSKEIGKHKFSIMGTAEQRESKNSGMSLEWRGQQLPTVDDPFGFNPAPTRYDATRDASAKRSFLTRSSYGFAGKYNVDAIVRFDASSNFARGKVWGVSPTVGANWIVSAEPFFADNVHFIDYFKVRASLGITGDDRVNSRLWQERYKLSNESAAFGDSMAVGIKAQTYPNPNITWERKRTLNVGFEAGLLNNRLNIGMEFFHNYVYDAFDKNGDAAYPAYSGFRAPIVNFQKRYGWGSEFSISYNQPFRNDWNLKVATNFSFSRSVLAQAVYNKNELWNRYPGEWLDQIGLNNQIYNSSNYGLIALGMFRTQQDVDAFLAKNPNYTIAGITPQPGWLYYKDTNGDGKITETDKTLMYEKGTDPWWSSALQVGVAHKSFSFNVNVGFSFGGKQTFDNKIRSTTPSFFENVAQVWTDRWTPETPNGKFPRADDPSLSWESTFWSFDATTIRVNDMQLAYKLPAPVCKRIGFTNVSVNLAAENLFVLKNPTPYKDPDIKYIYDYPMLRTISAGLIFGF